MAAIFQERRIGESYHLVCWAADDLTFDRR
jgi:hypothetical protein